MKKIAFIWVFFLVSLSISFWNYNFSRDLTWVKIITRKQWGADSKYLFADYKAYKKLILNQKKYLDSLKHNPIAYKKYLEEQAIEKEKERYLLKNWKNEIRVNKVVKKIDGKKLWWWLAYKYNKTKIIIHHTATNYSKLKNVSDVEKLIRWIYYYHAIKRGWWDIWYNFLIWPFGNIYEWRFWWDSVVGANSKRNNVPSIWIALIWNFNQQKPTQAQIKSLIKLATALAKKYHIDPTKKVIYHEDGVWKYAKKYPYLMNVTGYALAGHRDTWHTSCPWKYLYELLPYIREKVKEQLKSYKSNLYSSSKIKLVSAKTFDKEKKIHLKLKFWLYPEITIKLAWEKFISCKSLSEGINVNCIGDKIVIKDVIKKPVVSRNISIQAKTKDITYNINFKAIFLDDLRLIVKKQVEKSYKLNSHKIKKIQHKIYISELKKIYKLPVNVLLYDLTTKFKHYDFKCSKVCVLYTDRWTYTAKTFSVDKVDPLIVWIGNKAISTSKLTIDSVGGFIKFTNYHRKSFAWILWNFFRWKILIKKDYIKPIWELEKYEYVVINSLPLNDYLKWIAEWNDQMPIEKLKVMALLAKDYILFYQNKKNIHPSIPVKASYNAVDDPRIFQKYVWAGFEATSKKWQKALEQTRNEVILYDSYIPILPYFSCSKGFTFSARQKFWRVDTPYLQNAPDLWKCDRFYGHWVGLSGKWAEILAKKGLNYKQILQWYFPGVKVVKIDFSK